MIGAERTDGVLVLTIQRPEVMNALDRELVEDLAARVEEAAGDADVHAVVITGAGGRSFAAGADVRQLAALGPGEAEEYARAGQHAFGRIAAAPVPSVAAIRGFALGGGFELALACDIRIAAEDARFGLPEVRLGLIPGWGGTQRLALLAGPSAARDLVLTGRTVDAAEAMRLGLLRDVVPAEDLLARAVGVGAGFASLGRSAVAAAKEAMAPALAEGLGREAAVFAGQHATDEARAGMGAFLERSARKG